jgi:hypothetical protein
MLWIRSLLVGCVALWLLGTCMTGVIVASDYGVVCNGVTDTTTQLRNAFAAAQVGTDGLTLWMPTGGTCKLSGTITISSVLGLVLEGNGVTFTWAGNNSSPMFLCQDCVGSTFRNFRVTVSVSTPILNIMQFENGPGATLAPTHNTVSHVHIQCTNGGCVDGFRMALGAGGDNNNDFNVFSNVTVNNASGSCVRIDHSQSKSNLLMDFSCSNNGIGSFIVNAVSGSFHCIRCNGGGSLVADFFLQQAIDNIEISNGNFENSIMFLKTGGPSGAALPLTLINNRWGNPNLQPSGEAVLFQFPGPLVMINNLFEGKENSKALSIRYNPLGGGGGFTSIGNYYASTLPSPFTGVPPTHSLGDTIDRNDGANVVALKTRLSELTTSGAAAGKTVLCVDRTTGQLYASSSASTCAN